MTKKTSVPRKPRGTSDDAPGVAIGRRVAQLMDAHGMRVNELDRKIGQKGYTSRLIRGKKPHPTLPVLQKLAAVFGANLAWLQEGKGEPGAPVAAAIEDPKAQAREVVKTLADGIPGVDERDLRALDRIKPGPADAGDEPWWRAQLIRVVGEREALERELAPRSRATFRSQPRELAKPPKSQADNGDDDKD